MIWIDLASAEFVRPRYYQRSLRKGPRQLVDTGRYGGVLKRAHVPRIVKSGARQRQAEGVPAIGPYHSGKCFETPCRRADGLPEIQSDTVPDWTIVVVAETLITSPFPCLHLRKRAVVRSTGITQSALGPPQIISPPSRSGIVHRLASCRGPPRNSAHRCPRAWPAAMLALAFRAAPSPTGSGWGEGGRPKNGGRGHGVTDAGGLILADTQDATVANRQMVSRGSK